MEKAALLLVGLSLTLVTVSLLGILLWSPPASMQMESTREMAITPDMWLMMVWPGLLGASLVTLVVGALFYILYRPPRATIPSTSPPLLAEDPTYPVALVARFLKPDEQQVIQALRAAGGSLLQREITRRTGFTRLKTHRILIRLADRGVIEVEKAGKTNRVSFAPWLKERELMHTDAGLRNERAAASPPQAANPRAAE